MEQESNPSQWGQLLYQDNSIAKDNRNEGILALVIAIIFGAFFMGLGFVPGVNDRGRWFCIVAGILVIGFIGSLVAFLPRNPFQIYEKGIRFTDHGRFLLFFKEINHIKIVEYGDLKIFSKDGLRYSIANCTEPVKFYTECPRNFARVSQLILERMRVCNSHRNQLYIIRDIYHIKWSHEALSELKSRWGGKPDRKIIWSEIADSVAAQGRDLVKLKDVNIYAERLSGRNA